MRRSPLAVPVCALAACLSTPPIPGDGNGSGSDGPSLTNRMHHMVAVGRLGSDTFDTAVLWGHDDSGSDGVASLFLYRGMFATQYHDTVPLEFPVPVSDLEGQPAQWHEPIAAAIADVGAGVNGVVVMSAIDGVRPVPAGQPMHRYLYVSRLTPADLDASGPTRGVHTNAPPMRDVGAYVDDQGPVFVLRRAVPSGDQILFGDQGSVFSVPAGFALGADPMELGPPPYTYADTGLPSLDQNVIQGVIPMPAQGTQADLLVVSTMYAFATTNPDPGPAAALYLGNAIPLTGGFRRVRSHVDGAKTYAVSTDADDQYFTFVVADAGHDLTAYSLLAIGPATATTSGTASSDNVDDLALGQLGSGSDLDLATIDGGQLLVYLDVPLAGSDAQVAAAKTIQASLDPAYDLLAVGNFNNSVAQQILVFNRSSLSAPVLCFIVNPNGDGFDRC